MDGRRPVRDMGILRSVPRDLTEKDGVLAACYANAVLPCQYNAAEAVQSALGICELTVVGMYELEPGEWGHHGEDPKRLALCEFSLCWVVYPRDMFSWCLMSLSFSVG